MIRFALASIFGGTSIYKGTICNEAGSHIWFFCLTQAGTIPS